jgi:GNAT superfamily N-acetyltransferase
MSFTLRPAIPEDAEAIAAVYAASFRLLTFLPMLHTVESYRWYVANRMLKEWAVTVAEDDTGIVAFLGLRGEEVGHFYTRPDRIGRGAGTQLIEAAKSSGVAALKLWSTRAPGASTKPEAFARSASATARIMRRRRRTSAIAGEVGRLKSF